MSARGHLARQTDLVLGALSVGPMTNWDMWTRLGVGRGHARVHELRAMGFPIVTKMITRLNRRGDESKIALYTLTNGGRRRNADVLASIRRKPRKRPTARRRPAACRRRQGRG